MIFKYRPETSASELRKTGYALLKDILSDEDAEEFRLDMARLTGIPGQDFTIAERHLKV